MATQDVPFYVIERDTYSTVKRVVPEGKTTCALCSRLRRGTLYGFAEAHEVTKIALGHHRDDIVETLFLNLFFGSKLKTMPPKLVSDDGRYVVIRPLAYCKESGPGSVCCGSSLSHHSLSSVRITAESEAC